MGDVKNRITLLVRKNGRLVGKIIASDSDLTTEDMGLSKIETCSFGFHVNGFLRVKPGCKSEIISTLRDFSFANCSSFSQSSLSFVVSPINCYGILYGQVDTATVLSFDGEEYQLGYFKSEKVEKFKERIQSFLRLDGCMCLKLGVKQNLPSFKNAYSITQKLKDYRLMSSYEISSESIIFIKGIRETKGRCCLPLSIDLSQPSLIQDKGVPCKQIWKCYGIGLNIIGNCENRKCESKGADVTVKLIYPEPLVLTGSSGKIYTCPACNKKDKPITIKTFVVSAARAKFKFTKTLSDEAETTILESPTDSYDDYTMMKEDRSEKIDYDYVEITVAKFGMSFDKCQNCNSGIQLSEEKIMPCGRAFHERCLSENSKCPVCELPEVDLDDLPDMVTNPKRQDIVVDVPNQIFKNCESTKKTRFQKNHVKPINGFIRRLSASQMKNAGKNKIPLIELQQTFITANLAMLERNLDVNADLVKKLVEMRLLSNSDRNKLNAVENEGKKSRILLRLIGAHESGITKLMEALRDRNQPRTVAILSNFDIMLNVFKRSTRQQEQYVPSDYPKSFKHISSNWTLQKAELVVLGL